MKVHFKRRVKQSQFRTSRNRPTSRLTEDSNGEDERDSRAWEWVRPMHACVFCQNAATSSSVVGADAEDHRCACFKWHNSNFETTYRITSGFNDGGQYNPHNMWVKKILSVVGCNMTETNLPFYAGLGKRVVPRLLELAPCGQRESGGRIHAT